MAFFHMQCCLEPLGQHCIGFCPVQCCPNSIKTTLNRIFFLSSVAWTLSDNLAQGFDLFNVDQRVLRKHCTGVFYALLSGASRRTLCRVFTCAMLFGASWTTLHRIFICAILSQEYLLHRKNISQEKPYVVLSLRLQATLHKKKSYSMLS